VGFEPTEPAKVQRFSRPPDSTTLAPHRISNLPDFRNAGKLACLATLKGVCATPTGAVHDTIAGGSQSWPVLGAGFKPAVRYFVSRVGSTPTGFRHLSLPRFRTFPSRRGPDVPGEIFGGRIFREILANQHPASQVRQEGKSPSTLAGSATPCSRPAPDEKLNRSPVVRGYCCHRIKDRREYRQPAHRAYRKLLRIIVQGPICRFMNEIAVGR
jgi:hypothetical protein